MATYREKSERLLNLIMYLLNIHEPVRFSDILENIHYYSGQNIETSRKMFFRDKEFLKEQGIVIDHEDDGFFIDKSRFYLPDIYLDDPEKTTLKLLISYFLGQGNVPVLSNSFKSALRKLSIAAGVMDDTPMQDGTFLISQQIKKLNSNLEHHVNTIAIAILNRERLRFHYTRSGESEKKPRSADPLGVLFRSGTPYLVAYCHKRRDIRVFNIFRITDLKKNMIEPDETGFQIPQGFSLKKYSDKEAWEFEIEKPYKASIRFSPEVAWLVEKKYSGRYPVTKLEDGCLLLEPTVSNTEGIIGFVMSFSKDAYVEKPLKLRRSLIETIRTILTDYRELL